MTSKFLNPPPKAPEDESEVFWEASFECLLNDVIAMLVFHHFQHIWLKFADQCRPLFDKHVIESL